MAFLIRLHTIKKGVQMEPIDTLTPETIISEVEGFTDSVTWFKPTNPLIEPVEELDFIIDGFCARGMITTIGASPGAGKSILTQFLFSKHHNGLMTVKKGARAIYLVGADSSETEIRRRARSIRVNDGLYTVEPPEEIYCTMNNEFFVQTLKDAITQGEFDAIIFDTVADYHEKSTYEAELVNKTMSIFRKLAKDTNSAVILITHTKKGSKIKAEYNVEDIADSRIFTSKSDFVFGIKSEYQDDSTNLIELQNLKSRSPQPLPKIRALIRYDTSEGLNITVTDRQFRTELDSNDKENKKYARISQAKQLSAEGKSQREIAEIMGCSPATINGFLKT